MSQTILSTKREMRKIYEQRNIIPARQHSILKTVKGLIVYIIDVMTEQKRFTWHLSYYVTPIPSVYIENPEGCYGGGKEEQQNSNLFAAIKLVDPTKNPQKNMLNFFIQQNLFFRQITTISR